MSTHLSLNGGKKKEQKERGECVPLQILAQIGFLCLKWKWDGLGLYVICGKPRLMQTRRGSTYIGCGCSIQIQCRLRSTKDKLNTGSINSMTHGESIPYVHPWMQWAGAKTQRRLGRIILFNVVFFSKNSSKYPRDKRYSIGPNNLCCLSWKSLELTIWVHRRYQRALSRDLPSNIKFIDKRRETGTITLDLSTRLSTSRSLGLMTFNGRNSLL